MAGSGASRIQKPCDACKRYLDHLDGKNQNVRSFLSPMTASSKHSMVVPKRFLKHFAGKLSGIIKLESPNHGSYDVEVTEHYNKVVFRHGWGQFVESHRIKENDYLLFRHVEGSCFEVLIFDPDGCEKVFSCAGIRSSDYGYILSSSHYETTESSASERFVRCQKGSYHGKVTKIVAAFSSSEDSGEDIPSKNKSYEPDDLQTPLRQGYILSQSSYLSKAQEERVMECIQKIQPESTAFVAVIRKSYVDSRCPSLVIPKEYALAHFPHESTNVTLHMPGKSKKWHPKFYKSKNGTIYMLRGQWINFVRDNHVKEGDIWLFFPVMAGRRTMFTAYLIQAASACSRDGSGKRGSLSRQKETAKKAGTSSLDEESGEDSLSGYESIQSDHAKAFSELNYVLSARCHLTEEEEERIVALLTKVQPEIPVLVVQMKKSNVNRLNTNLVICKGYAAQHFPQKSQFITLERPGGKRWRTWLHVRPGRRAYILTSRWQNFVRDNHLQKDGICLFQPMPSEKGFRVMVHLLCEPSTRSSSWGGHAHGLNSHIERGVTSTANIHEKSDENSGSLELHKRRAGQQGHQVLSDSRGPSSSKPPLYVVLGGTCLTPAQNKAVQEKAVAIKAEVSIFVATMNNKILGYNNEAFILDLSDAAGYLPEGKQALTLRQQGQGRAWRTNLHNRLMLATGGWREFVRDSGLEDKDICLFEPIKNERLAMLVHIIRSKHYS